MKGVGEMRQKVTKEELEFAKKVLKKDKQKQPTQQRERGSGDSRIGLELVKKPGFVNNLAF